MGFGDKFGLSQEKSLGLLLQSLVVIIAIICSLYFSISAYSYGMFNFIAELIGLIACIILLVYSFGSKNKNYFVLSLALYVIVYLLWAIYYYERTGIANDLLNWVFFINLVLSFLAAYYLYNDSKFAGYCVITIFIIKIISEAVYIVFLGSTLFESILYCVSSLSFVLTYYYRLK